MNFEQARFNMVEQQVRPWDVLNQTVLDEMQSIPREDYVPTPYRRLAYADTAIPLDHQETMLPPREVGRLLQAVEPEKNDLALEIGTGTGYLTALLARLCGHVLSVEIHEPLKQQAQKNLASHNHGNVSLETGDAMLGWEHDGPYNIICLTGSVVNLPDSFLKSLHLGGRLFAYIGQAPVMRAVVFTRTGQNQWQDNTLYETFVPALRNAEQPSRFHFE